MNSIPTSLTDREEIREKNFGVVWTQELNEVFVDVAPYYDDANQVASLGLWNWFLYKFMSLVELKPGQKVLDVCAGTNAIGIALLKREPSLEIYAMDRSEAMQNVGKQRAEKLGFHIHSTIGDVHSLPFPDNHFDVVTLQFASRHLRIQHMFGEINRVLKPGGYFYHCDMLRPANKVVGKLYYAFLRFSLWFTGLMFKSGIAALNCKKYFIDTLQLFYSAEELTVILQEKGYTDIVEKNILFGMLGCHRAKKQS